MNTDSRSGFAFVTPVLTTMRSSSVLGCLTQVTCHSVIYAGHPQSHSPVAKYSHCTDHVVHGVETDARSLFQGLRSATSPKTGDGQSVLAGRRSPENRI